MCTMCVLKSQSEESCSFEVTTVTTYQTIIETSDSDWASGNVYYLSPGDTFLGSISFAGDIDTVRIWLDAGTIYTFDLSGIDGGGGSLSDPYLVLWDPAGYFVAENDDDGLTWDSSLTVTVTTSGYYDLDMSSSPYFDANGTGTYTLDASFGTPFVMPDAGTLDELADYLINGYWADNGISSRKFDTSVSNEITVNLTGLTAEGQQLARWALAIWSTYADLVFTEVAGAAQITFDDSEPGAYSSATTSGGTILSAEVNISVDWINSYGVTFDSYSLQTYIHEIGHALGLGHQGAYNGWAEFPYDATFANDSWQISVMSYFSQADNTLVDASEAYVVSPMMADILAIAQMYGLSDETFGDTTWGTGSTLGETMAMIFAALEDGASSPYYAGYPVALTISDTGGIDTIDLSGYLGDHYLSLVAETFSDIGGLVGSLGIARGTEIENAVGGDGNDTIIGNELDNGIWGGLGNDYLDGSSGDDVLYGSAGADTLDGGVGNDTLYGGNQGD
ncbi:M10 family metallopeptidase C-terminal domain-containing protein, partial [Pseudothioclava arenosa]